MASDIDILIVSTEMPEQMSKRSEIAMKDIRGDRTRRTGGAAHGQFRGVSLDTEDSCGDM